MDFFFSNRSGALYEFTDNPRRSGHTPMSTVGTGKKETHWSNWYDPDNKFPSEALALVLGNNILSGVLGTLVDFLIGHGVMTYTETITPDGKAQRQIVHDPVVDAFLQKIDVDEFLGKRYIDKLYFGNEWCEMLFDKGGKVIGLRHLDATIMRTGKKNPRTQRVDNHFRCGDWTKASYDPKAKGEDRKKQTVKLIPAFDPTAPTKYEKCVIHSKNYLPGHPNYPLPFWWATESWVRLASKIPNWHYLGIQNGYDIKYHVRIPNSWLDQFPAGDRADKKQELQDEMDDFFAGKKGSTFFSTYGNNGNLPDGWEILPINATLNDAAYTVLFGQSNLAVLSGLGVDPTLAGVLIEGRFGNASEKRIAYAIHMALKTPRPRAALLKVLKIVQKINGWNPAIKFGFKDIDLTTLDENPTGVQTVTAG